MKRSYSVYFEMERERGIYDSTSDMLKCESKDNYIYMRLISMFSEGFSFSTNIPYLCLESNFHWKDVPFSCHSTPTDC